MDDLGFLDQGGAKSPPQRAPALSSERAGKITASMASVVMGSDGVTREKYAKALAWERTFGVRDEGFASRFMERGLRLEPKALEWYRGHTGVELDFGPGFKAHKGLPFVGASPDGMATHGRRRWTVQAKCPGSDAWMDHFDTRDPLQYAWQCRWEAWVCGHKSTALVVWHPVAGGVVIDVPLTPEHASQMTARAVALEDRIKQWQDKLQEAL